ncbi:MAG: class I SAM-dependent methyltransferase [Lactobacillales bacterium]|jgi:SAM-dependent methyltransferase|nr:class I SAM-dependent methyltransferase [Lactobacillales bacterium]
MDNNYKCSICFNSKGNTSIVAKEMMFGLRESFTYFHCNVCGCLQLADIPSDLSKYYPQDYHVDISYINKNVKKIFVKKMKYFSKNYHFYKNLGINKYSNIMDCGCGNLELLKKLSDWGFQNLTGIDLYANNNQIENIRFIKQSIVDFNSSYGDFDLIMFHHSFEHMCNPHDVFEKSRKLLKDTGALLIRVPLCDSFVYRKYRANWYQLDAPRHIFLYTRMAMEILAEKHDFLIENVIYDSNKNQLINSEKYSNNITLNEYYEISAKRKRILNKYAKFLNFISDGDQAAFILRKRKK